MLDIVFLRNIDSVKNVNENKLLLFKKPAWHVMFFSSIVFSYFLLLKAIGVFSVESFLICLGFPRLHLFLKCFYFGPNIDARCSYTIVIIQKSVYYSKLKGKHKLKGMRFNFKGTRYKRYIHKKLPFIPLQMYPQHVQRTRLDRK